jgi:hypothetical protein
VKNTAKPNCSLERIKKTQLGHGQNYLLSLSCPGRSYILKIKGFFVGLAEYQDDGRRL